MTEDERQVVLDAIEQEGFGYCFQSWSAFPEIRDPEFHRLREAFVRAHQELSDYLEGA